MRIPYAYDVPYCVPYWDRRAPAAIARCAITGSLLRGSDVERLTRRLSARYGGAATLALSSARAAIEVGLRGAGIGPGDEVVVPSFCCRSILDPIFAVGAEPAFADVGDEWNLTEASAAAACTARTRAIIVPHLFGNPAPIEAIAEAARARGILVVDDAAQAIGARVEGGEVGTFGAFGVVSFGVGKPCFGTGGGVLVSSDEELARRAAEALPPPAKSGEALSHAIGTWLWRRHRRRTLPFRVALDRVPGLASRAPSHRTEGMRNVDAAVAGTLLDRLDENLQGRRARVERYRAAFAAAPRGTLVAHRPGSACLTQIVRIPPELAPRFPRQAALDLLRSEGVESSASYRPLHRSFPGTRTPEGGLETTEREADLLVELPCEPTVPLATIDRIASRLLDAWRRA